MVEIEYEVKRPPKLKTLAVSWQNWSGKVFWALDSRIVKT